MTPITRPPVPLWMYAEFVERVRFVTSDLDAPDTICGAARDQAQFFAWATNADIANALVDAYGPAYGALYLHWDADHKGRAA